MKASLDLFRQWTAQLRQLLPSLHGHRTKTLAFFSFGLVLAGKARLPLIAEELLAVSSANTPEHPAPPGTVRSRMNTSPLFPSGPGSWLTCSPFFAANA